MKAERWTIEHGGPRNSGQVKIEMAVRFADRWRERVPAWQELVSEYGMNRATAFRWIRAIKDARGIQ